MRAAMIAHPADYQWSSYRVNSGLISRGDLVAHQCYEALGLNNEQRQYAYREVCSIDLGDKIHDIRKAVNFSMPLGNTRFQLNSMMSIPLIDLFY